MYRAAFCQGGRLSTISAKEATKSRNMQQKGASMTIMMKPEAINQTPAIRHIGLIVMQAQAPKNIAARKWIFDFSFR